MHASHRRDSRSVFCRSDEVLLLLRTSFVSLRFRANNLKILTSELSFVGSTYLTLDSQAEWYISRMLIIHTLGFEPRPPIFYCCDTVGTSIS